MTDENQTIWGIHAGRTGDADRLFLEGNLIALGWDRMGDLEQFEPSREAFKSQVAKAYPEKKAGAIPNTAGQLFRFVHEMKLGDLVAYPSKQDREIHIGRIVGEYRYDPEGVLSYPNRRAVEWLVSTPRTRFSQGALYEIGSALSLFQIKTYAEDFFAKLGSEPSPETDDEDDTVVAVAEDVQETTRDFILKRLAKELKGHPFAGFVAHLLELMGFHTRVAPEGPDGGVDIIAHRDELGFEPPIVKVQVKSTEGSTGDPVVSALYGKVDASEFGLLVTLGTYTTPAKRFAESKGNLRLIDGGELVSLVLEHYEEFDSKYKGLIPMKRVYVPQALEDTDA